MLTLLVFYTAKPGMRDAFLSDLHSHGLPERIRLENGCNRYDYFYSSEKNDEILLVEQWTSQAAQNTHLEQPHMTELKILKEQYILSTKVEKIIES